LSKLQPPLRSLRLRRTSNLGAGVTRSQLSSEPAPNSGGAVSILKLYAPSGTVCPSHAACRASTILCVLKRRVLIEERRVIEHRKLDVNSDHLRGQTVTIGLLVNRYLETELAESRHSTANAYKSYLTSQIKPRWGNYPISKVKPFAVEQWLKGFDLAPRTRATI
jgi:hypothetical protein